VTEFVPLRIQKVGICTATGQQSKLNTNHHEGSRKVSLNEQKVFLLTCSRNLHISFNKPYGVTVFWHTGGSTY